MWELAVCLGYGNGFYALRVEFCYLYHVSHTRPSMFPFHSRALWACLGVDHSFCFWPRNVSSKCFSSVFCGLKLSRPWQNLELNSPHSYRTVKP